jgi:hypothetical protein
MNKIPAAIKALPLYLGAFLLIFGTRLVVLNTYGSSTPYFDDWEMGAFLHQFAAGEMGIVEWFTPAYQHQMFFSKVANVVLLSANNYQWDTLNVLIFNSVLWTVTALFLIYIARSNRQEINSNALTLVIIVFWLIPISIISATWSIVTHYYFMMLLLLIAYWGVGYSSGSRQQIIGLIALASCAFTIGAGVFAALPLALIFGYKLFHSPEQSNDSKRTLIALVIVALIAAASTLLWTLAEGNTDHYNSRSIEAFFETLFRTVGWPFIKNYGLGLLLYSPTIALVILVLLRSIKLTPLSIFIIALNTYMVMQAAGIALARNDATGMNPAPRYYEFLMLSIIANFTALLILLHNNKATPPLFKKGLLGVWILLLSSTIPQQLKIHNEIAVEEIKRKQNRVEISRNYLLSGDISGLTGHPYFRSPYPRSYVKLANWLDEYTDRGSLPMELQIVPPLELNESKVFAYRATVLPSINQLGARYQGEPAIGSYNLEFGAQNARGEFNSKTMVTDFPYLMIPSLGFLGLEGLSLELVDRESGEVTLLERTFRPMTAETWQSNYLSAPKGEFFIRAKDDSKKLWFGFAAPREVGRVSYITRKMLLHRHWIWAIGVFILFIYCLEPLTRILSGNRRDISDQSA